MAPKAYAVIGICTVYGTAYSIRYLYSSATMGGHHFTSARGTNEQTDGSHDRRFCFYSVCKSENGMCADCIHLLRTVYVDGIVRHGIRTVPDVQHTDIPQYSIPILYDTVYALYKVHGIRI